MKPSLESSIENARWTVSTASGHMYSVGVRSLKFILRIDGDDFTAAASHQKDPVQTFQKNLQELHVWGDSGQGTITDLTGEKLF